MKEDHSLEMKQPIFLESVFKERIWGGSKLRDLLGYEIPTEWTGEYWAVSAHPNGQSVVQNGQLKGKTLGSLWEEHRELFGTAAGKSDVFPLLTKVLDASKDLSVQVHPDDAYAQQYENGELGKTECWYILDAEPGAEIVYGHTAKTREELTRMIEDGRWDELLCKVKVKPGDFFYVPSGTIHALGAGIVVLETQQSSDTTYRVYDYDRTDDAGNKRELHLDKAIQVTTVPHVAGTTEAQQTKLEDAVITTYVANEFFTVQKLVLNGHVQLPEEVTFKIFSVIQGNGRLELGGETYELAKGDHFIVPALAGNGKLSGELEFIISWT